jgi:hypothetical protein
MTFRLAMTLVLAVGCASQAMAQEVVKDRRQLHDDRSDRARIINIAHDWEKAIASKNRAAEQAADARLKLWLVEELGESTLEAGQARREVRQSRAERNASGTRDDQRDLRDDRRDRAVATGEAVGTRAIAGQLRAMQPSFDAGTATTVQYASKRELLGKLAASAQAQVHRDKKEIREDRRERREDRR